MNIERRKAKKRLEIGRKLGAYKTNIKLGRSTSKLDGERLDEKGEAILVGKGVQKKDVMVTSKLDGTIEILRLGSNLDRMRDNSDSNVRGKLGSTLAFNPVSKLGTGL